MDDIQKAILEARSKQRELITKGFEPQDDSTIEKAKWNPGDIHPNGKWVFTEYKPGKFDWRNIKSTGAQSKPAAATQSKPDVAKQSETSKKVVYEHVYNGKKYRKQSNGKWLEVSTEGMTKKEHEAKAKEHDSNVNAIMSDDSIPYFKAAKDVREAKNHRDLSEDLSDKERTDEEVGLGAKKKDEEKGYKKGSFVTYEIANIPHEGRVVSVDKDGKYANVRNLAGDLNYISVKKLKSATEAEQKSIETKFKSRKYADGKTYNEEFEDEEIGIGKNDKNTFSAAFKTVENKLKSISEKINSLYTASHPAPTKIKNFINDFEGTAESIFKKLPENLFNFKFDLEQNWSDGNKKLDITAKVGFNTSLILKEYKKEWDERKKKYSYARPMEFCNYKMGELMKQYGIEKLVKFQPAAGWDESGGNINGIILHKNIS